MSRGTALVTGASSGIGAALARELAARDFDLIITGRRQHLLNDLAAELGERVVVDVLAADLSTDLDSLIRDLAELGKPIDVLINNAGISAVGPFAAAQPIMISNILDVNVKACILLTHAMLPDMLKRGSGRILNVASVAGFTPLPGMSLYAASKALVLSFTEGLSEELVNTGVSVTALCPGLTETETVNPGSRLELPQAVMSSAENVAEEAITALLSKQVICIPGNLNKAAVTWARYQPRWLIRKLAGAFTRQTTP
jgi:short-subunit dehydrogenase